MTTEVSTLDVNETLSLKCFSKHLFIAVCRVLLPKRIPSLFKRAHVLTDVPDNGRRASFRFRTMV